jgi:hypothetical protein
VKAVRTARSAAKRITLHGDGHVAEEVEERAGWGKGKRRSPREAGKGVAGMKNLGIDGLEYLIEQIFSPIWGSSPLLVLQASLLYKVLYQSNGKETVDGDFVAFSLDIEVQSEDTSVVDVKDEELCIKQVIFQGNTVIPQRSRPTLLTLPPVFTDCLVRIVGRILLSLPLH